MTRQNVNGAGIVDLWHSGAGVRIPFSCTSCGLCAVNCSRKLDPGQVFSAWRHEAVSKDPTLLDPVAMLQTDQPDTIYQAYRRRYPAVNPFPEPQPARIAFFPGCALSSFTPELAWAAFDALQHCYPEVGWVDQCCTDLLDKLAAQDRYQAATDKLSIHVQTLGIETLITACPTCTYRLKKALPQTKVIPIYEAIQNRYQAAALPENPLAFHDSCSDRYTQAIGKAARSLLKGEIKVLKNEGKQSQCCGAGSGLPFFDAELSRSLRQLSIDDAQACGAKTLVTYCTSCALQLAENPAEVQITHILDLVLGNHHDYSQLAAQRVDLFH